MVLQNGLQNLGKVQKLGWSNTLEAHLGSRNIGKKVVIGQGRKGISLVFTSQRSAGVNGPELC
jgi:hypothetical protein